MKKLLVLILVVALALSAAACSSWKTTVTEYGGEIYGNGGFAVTKGDYVYLINGKAYNTDDNTFGNVVKGAIVRVKVADLGKADAVAEIVVPKIAYTEYYGSGSGLFISGDYVYYPTPSDKKSSTGEVKNGETEFMKTKLDGSGSSIITTVPALDSPYRFYEKDGKVFLTVYLSDTEDDSTIDRFITYDEDGNIIKKSKKIAGYDLGEFGSDYAYYVRTAYNETLEQDESFNEVYRYAFDGSKDELILNGVGGYTDKENGIGTQGVTFEIKKNAKTDLFLSMTYVDTSVAAFTGYYAIAHADLTGDSAANYKALVLLNDGDDNASAIFSENSVYFSRNAIVYSDSTYGLISYNYQAEDKDLREGLVYLSDDEDLLTLTFEYAEGNYLYFSKDGYYYRLDASALVDFTTGAKKDGASSVKAERLTYKTTYTKGDWFNAEIIGEVMLFVKTGEPYYSYVYSVGFKDIETKYEKSIADITEDEISDYESELAKTDKVAVTNALKTRVGILSAEDKTSTETYIEELEE